MTGEVVRPFGDFGTPGPVEAVVEQLEDLLAQAQAGEIVGLVFAAARPNRVAHFGFTAGTADAHVLVSGAALAQYLITKDMEARGNP